jgi:hypothetical protein
MPAFRISLLRHAAWITCALTTASPVYAQRLPRLLGARVRIEVDTSVSISGVVIRQTTDSLTIRLPGSDLDYPAPLAVVRHVERYTPRGSALLVLGGFVAGGSLGYVLGGYATSHGTAQCRATSGHNDMCALDPVTLPAFTLGGALLGLVVGDLLKLPHWEPLY